MNTFLLALPAIAILALVGYLFSRSRSKGSTPNIHNGGQGSTPTPEPTNPTSPAPIQQD